MNIEAVNEQLNSKIIPKQIKKAVISLEITAFNYKLFFFLFSLKNSAKPLKTASIHFYAI